MSTENHHDRTPQDETREARAARVSEMDARLKAARPLLARLEDAAEELRQAASTVEELFDYYEGDWSSDRELLEGTDAGDADVLSEDGIWDEAARYRSVLADLQERTGRALERWDAAG